MVLNEGLGFLSVTDGRVRQTRVVNKKVQGLSSVQVPQEVTRGSVGVGGDATKLGWGQVREDLKSQLQTWCPK